LDEEQRNRFFNLSSYGEDGSRGFNLLFRGSFAPL
jgi:hypothetical protein